MVVAMTSVDSKNDMLVMVLSDLAAICMKLADNSALPEELRAQARKFVSEFNFLLPFRGKATASQFCTAEALLSSIATFLARVIEVRAEPRSNAA